MVYTSNENSLIKEIKKLNTKKYRDLSDNFLVEGKNLVTLAYQNGYLKTLILLEGTEFELDIETIVVDSKVMKYITELDSPTKIVGVCMKKRDIVKGNKILVLDNIQDPGNLGTIIRSAVAFNIDTIILSEDTVDLYNSKVLRSTQGLLFNINIVITDIKSMIMHLKNIGYKIYTTKVEDGNELKNIEFSSKFVIVMGNEGHGISEDIQNLSDEYIYIKMSEKCESLNVGVATSIILYEVGDL
ncbi:MAG: RNA methyltransferase [Bacilli bacterium]|nr:RNA methyltransferase [Bacilli bacterium]MDD4733527.1 RNA methyltransferase [Bacilli bacterium]